MKLVDSSGWLELFTDGPLAREYETHLAEPDGLSSTIVLFEVYKWVRRQRSEEEALICAATIARTNVVAPGSALALAAADLGLEHGLAMADSLIYATARVHGAELVTSDRDFEGLPGVTYLAR